MEETLVFHFEGSLADTHRMNFYESARFQYAAARLLVKLAQFRKEGKFVKNITNNSNFNIQLVAQSDGSFNINVEDPGQSSADAQFVQVSLADLIAYISERLIEKIGHSVRSGPESELLGKSLDDPTPSEDDELERMADTVLTGSPLTASLPAAIKEMVRRRAAEAHRERRLEANKAALSRIDFTRSQRLVAMAAPLMSDMSTALRRSADTLEVTSSRDGNSVLFLNREMAQQIETATVDKDITPILGDVIQFNKRNGWGKIRFEDGSVTVSFSVPSDILHSIRQKIIDSMNRDKVYLQAYFVRDRSGKVVRLIIVGVLPTPTA